MLNRILLTLFFINYANIYAQAPIEFVENKGQENNTVKFSGVFSGGNYYLQKNGYTVCLDNEEDKAAIHLLTHPISSNDSSKNNNKTLANITQERHYAYQVKFLNAELNVNAVGEKKLSYVNNYFLGEDKTKWASNCSVFEAVVYKNIYPNVDLRYYSNNGFLKYDFIVNPGADVSKIALQYDGLNGIEIKKNELILKTSFGEIKELQPICYQAGLESRVAVKCKYKLKRNVVTFSLDDYDETKTLIIDPIIFCSFTGSKSDNFGFTATYGPDGSFYSGGIVFGSGFPTTLGAFQTAFSGNVDIGIMKTNANGSQKLYATYIGGNGDDIPHSLICDPKGNLVVAGRTSSSNYPLKTNSGTSSYGSNGNFDIIISKLSFNGGLLSSIRIGGDRNDGVNINPSYNTGPTSLIRFYGDQSRSEVITDAASNVYLASNTQSENFPTTSTAFQKQNAGGQDGVFLKFNENLKLLFSSYFGGEKNDASFVLTQSPTTKNIYLAGPTESQNLPGDKTGALSPSFIGGGTDGYITEIKDDSILVKTTYVGTGASDFLYGIQTDRKGFPYIMGVTLGSWPIINAAFSQNGGKQYIAKLQPNLSGFVYSTNFGTNSIVPNISPVAMLVDRCENVYVSGWGGSFEGNFAGTNAGPAGLTTTADAFKTNPGSDNFDFYFFVLEKNATKQLFGSFFGQNLGLGEHVDGGTSRFDVNGVIYQAICGNCDGREQRPPGFPTTPGVIARFNGTTRPNGRVDGCNLAMLKINFNLAGVGAGARSSIQGIPGKKFGCVPLTVNFTDTIGNGIKYEWNFGDGSPFVTSTNANVVHTFNNVGNYLVRLVAFDPKSCNETDTSFVTIKVGNNKMPVDYSYLKIGGCNSLNYEFTNLSVPSALKPFTDSSFVWDFNDGSDLVYNNGAKVNHTFPGVGTYLVKLTLLDSFFCNSPETVTKNIRIATNVKASFTANDACDPDPVYFKNTSNGGTDFIWEFGDGNTSILEEPAHKYLNIGTYQVRLIATDLQTCNKVDTSAYKTIHLRPKPKADFSFSPAGSNPPPNTPTFFTNLSSGEKKLLYEFGDGTDFTTTDLIKPVKHQYNSTFEYTATLIVENEFGCRDTTSKNVFANINPLLDVPNAFTPGRFGENSVISVRGFGIDEIDFKIYNRWGQIVFQTNDRFGEWDGTYKGVLQPMDVYTYTLDVIYTDLTKTRKTGDITLLR